MLLFGTESASALHTQNEREPVRYYELGREKYDAGQWQEALRIWMTAITDSSFIDPDPRLGFGFIQLVTEKELKHLYYSASLLYNWSLTGEDISSYGDALTKEVERIRPILDNGTYKKWNDLAKVGDATLLREIRAYWLAMDPTPMQQPNERLIEHWERIAFARKNFTKNQSSIYGTDDRGVVYVRYGKPDRERSGILNAEESEIRSKLNELNGMNPDVRRSGQEFWVSAMQMSNMRANYHPAEYEIWIYNMIDRQGTGTFIFGSPGDGGRYGLRKSLEEFLPRSASKAAIERPADGAYGQIAEADVLTMGIYRDLAALDPVFAETFTDYERSWGQYLSGNANAELYKHMTDNSKAQHRISQGQKLLRLTRSEYDKKYAPVDNAIQVYRVMNNNEPGFLVVNNTNPTLAASIDAGTMRDNETSRSYALKDAVAIFDADWRVLDYMEEMPRMNVVNDPLLVLSDNSAFYIPYTMSDMKNVRFSSEFYRMGTEGMFRSTETAEIVGASNVEVALPEPLEAGTFTVSDIILIDMMLTSDKERPQYKVLPANRINPEGSLGMYFEVYNVPGGAGGNQDYRVSYTIKENKKGLLRRSEKTRVQISANFRAFEQQSNEMLEIDTSKLKPGLYTCEMEFVSASGTVTREFSFEIAK